MSAKSTSGAAAPVRLRVLHVWLGCLVAGSTWFAPAQAQNDLSLPHLLFEPVLLEVVEAEAGTSGTDVAPYTARELTVLPRSTTTGADLQTWLRENNTTAIVQRDNIDADIAAYEQAILDIESTGGAFDARLDQELLSLATLLQQSGELTRAQEVLERALHVNRVNSGLFGMGQIPIIERTIENYLARGDLVSADEQQEYLLYVQRKNHGDRAVELLPALTRYAEWNLFAFRARLVAMPPPSANAEDGDDLPPAPQPQLDENSDVMQQFRTGRLISAHNVYQSLINIVANNFGIGDSRVMDFERQLALTNYLFITTFGLDSELGTTLMPLNSYMMPYDTMEMGRPPLGFRQGRDSLERRVEYLASEPDVSAADRAQAKLDLADWMLMFSKRMSSLDIYLEAWQDMVNAGATQQELDALLNPAFPHMIPTYVEHPYTRESMKIPANLALEYKGYIDVEFELSRFGEPSSMRVLGRSPTATPELETRLLRSIRRTQYRPRVSDGEVRSGQQMYARYYFTY
jgi:tetratricopeptide (TPR) repeat protein